jgi:hypothetical protein
LVKHYARALKGILTAQGALPGIGLSWTLFFSERLLEHLLQGPQFLAHLPPQIRTHRGVDRRHGCRRQITTESNDIVRNDDSLIPANDYCASKIVGVGDVATNSRRAVRESEVFFPVARNFLSSIFAIFFGGDFRCFLAG